jgi:hypothetical protein
MRGEDRTSGGVFSYIDIELVIGAKHPLRAMRRLTNGAIAEFDGKFSALYEAVGVRPPHRNACCGLRCCSFSIRSARGGNWSNGWNSTCCFAGSSGFDEEDGTVDGQGGQSGSC